MIVRHDEVGEVRTAIFRGAQRVEGEQAGQGVVVAAGQPGLDEERAELIELLALAAVVVTPAETVTIARDPDDDRLIEAALAAADDVIMSGSESDHIRPKKQSRFRKGRQQDP